MQIYSIIMSEVQFFHIGTSFSCRDDITQAENLVYSAERLVSQDFKDKIKPKQTEKINKAVQELKNVIARESLQFLSN